MVHNVGAKAPHGTRANSEVPGTFPNFKGNTMTPIRHHDNYYLKILILNHVVFLSATSCLYETRFSIVADRAGWDRAGVLSACAVRQEDSRSRCGVTGQVHPGRKDEVGWPREPTTSTFHFAYTAGRRNHWFWISIDTTDDAANLFQKN